MLELTEAASAQLHRSLAGTKMPDHEGKCFRIVPKNEQYLTLKLARPAPSDSTFEHEGDTVLALPEALRPFFNGRSLDIDNSGNLKLI